MTLRFYKLIMSLLMLTIVMTAQSAIVSELTPSSWWTNMPSGRLLVLVKGKDLFGATASTNYPGVKITNAIPTSKTDFLLLEIEISSDAVSGAVPIVFRNSKNWNQTIFLSLNQRVQQDPAPIGINDAIYSVAIDRFVNGLTANDRPSGYLENTDRTNPASIHGGDIAGLITRLDYIKNLGFTSVLLSPITENNQQSLSYMGDAPTDFYKTDPRLGSQTEYFRLNTECRERGLKVIQSFNLHQAGRNSGIFADPPLSSWILPDTKNYNTTPNPLASIDIYASITDRNRSLAMWSSPQTPLLNQNDNLLNKYLLQSVIWWVENSKASAIKIESAWRNNPVFIHFLLETLQQTHPSLKVILDAQFEVNTQLQAWVQQFEKHSNLLLSDYPMSKTIGSAFSRFTMPSDGCNLLYQLIVPDALYPAPSTNIIFADSPIGNRAWNNADKDIEVLKMMLTYTLTMRGIPLMHYGTETIMEGITTQSSHFFYKDFPGGWSNDTQDFFNYRSHNNNQLQMFQLITRLLKWRADNPALLYSPITQFEPQKGFYAYYRNVGKTTVMVLINNNREPIRLDFRDFPETLNLYEQVRDIVSGETFIHTGSILMKAKSSLVLEMKEMKP